MQQLVQRAICHFLFFSKLASNLPLRIIHARISNNLNKEFIMMKKFTIHVKRSFVFKNSSAQSPNKGFSFLCCRNLLNIRDSYAESLLILDRDY